MSAGVAVSFPIPAAIDDDHDELDLLTAIAPDVFYGASLPMPARKSERLKKSTMPMPKPTKRKRTTSNAASNGDKRRKMDEKKAATVRVNERKDTRDAAMKRWLHHNWHLLAPLLPSTTQLSDALGPPQELQELVEQPSLIKGGEMKDYQLHGLSFLVNMYKNGMNCILGDEMGLGKTLQTLSLFAYIQEHSKTPLDAPHLVICPLSVLSSWEAEAAHWLPSFRVLRFHGAAAQRTLIKKTFGESAYDLVLTTYDAFAVEDSWFKNRRWTYCVLDEGHKIKNAGTQIANKVQGNGSLYRLILTGTPVQNDLVEVWALLHYLYPTVFTERTEAKFRASFDLGQGTYNVPFLTAVQKFLAAIMLRRTKSTVAIDVPPKEELTVFIPLSEAQRFWTYRLLTQMDTMDLETIFDMGMEVGDKVVEEGRREVLSHLQADVGMRNVRTGEKQMWQRLNFILLQLQRLCDHPYLLPDAEPDPYIPGEHVVAASSKLVAIDKILGDVLPKGEQVLIFSLINHCRSRMLDILSDFLTLRRIPFARLDGSTLRPRRTLDIKLVPYKVYLISTTAGGLGINLTKASTVIMTDSCWNPQNDLQAVARAHGSGRRRLSSVEDQMLDRIRRKLFLSIKVMESSSGASAGSEVNLGLNELRDILRKGSSALSDDGMSLKQFLDAPISEILDASRERERSRDAKAQADEGASVEERKVLSAEEEERQLLSGVAQVKTRLFEGRLVQKVRRGALTTPLESKRERVNNSVSVGGMSYLVGGLTPDQIQARAEERHALEKAHKVKRKKLWENEDFCLFCRDGGEVVMCEHCPRVFHAACAGLGPRDVKKPFVVCGQHHCHGCERTTAEAGGMLFRCRTCPTALCDECIPEDPEIVGEVLPEFQLLNYNASAAAFFISCEECPAWWADVWGKDLRARRRSIW
ncbi:hypothetical protein BDZ89DRAFT_1061181 [Hymenopellis radicata]|nr:hypothetical protein BDZ89DRAFT_1061181 [Hymenopellis radicata]